MKVLVISAAIGSKSTKSISEQSGHDVDFVFYNDDNYQLRKLSFTPRMNAKTFKMLAWELHPGYDMYIWMDSYFSMNRNDAVDWFVEKIGRKEALFFNHPNRSSIMDEANYMESEAARGNQHLKNRVDGEPVLKQVGMYLRKGYVDDLLIAASSFCYKPTDAVKMALKDWYLNVCLYSIRDQISLPYVLKQHKINFELINENVFELRYLK